MYILNINIDGVTAFIGGAALLVGILSWWLSKLLGDKKDITIVQVKLENLERRMTEVEHEVDDLQRK